MPSHATPVEGRGTEVVGLIIALPAEARSIGVRGIPRAGGCMRWPHGWVAISGVGPHNAMRAAERLLACGVTRLANWGVAGGLDAALAPGDVLIPERVLYAPGDPGFETDRGAGELLAGILSVALTVRRGVLWSAEQPVATAADKLALAKRSGAVAVDMEAAPIAAVAARANLPFVAVKAICDSASREMPERMASALDDGGVSWRMLAAIAFGGPATWRAARALSRDFARARHSLAAAARLLPRGALAA